MSRKNSPALSFSGQSPNGPSEKLIGAALATSPTILEAVPTKQVPPEEGEALRMLFNQLEQRKQQLYDFACQVDRTETWEKQLRSFADQIRKERVASDKALAEAAAKLGISDPKVHGTWRLDLTTLVFTRVASPS